MTAPFHIAKSVNAEWSVLHYIFSEYFRNMFMYIFYRKYLPHKSENLMYWHILPILKVLK